MVVWFIFSRVERSPTHISFNSSEIIILSLVLSLNML